MNVRYAALLVGLVAGDASSAEPEAYVLEKAIVPSGLPLVGENVLLVVPDDRWGPFEKQALRVDFTTGKLSVALRCPAGQTAWTAFPLVLGNGVRSAGFDARDGQLYCAGAKDGQRVRFTGAVPRMPLAFKARAAGIEIQFTCTLDTQLAREPANWRLVAEGGKSLAISTIDIGTDDRTVFLHVAEFTTTPRLTIRYDLKSSDDLPLRGEILATIAASR